MAPFSNKIGCFIAVVLGLCQGPVIGAEDEVVLLTVEGNLIGLTMPFDGSISSREEALRLADAYHQLLPPAALAQVEVLHEQVLRLIPDFQVAYAAADSAEITHVMSEIDIRLAAMQEVYTREYTQQVMELLSEAYQVILPGFGDK